VGNGHRVCAVRSALAGTAVLLLGLATLPAYGFMVVLSVGIGLLYGPINPLLNYAMQTRSPRTCVDAS
jgi:hypothetical protein